MLFTRKLSPRVLLPTLSNAAFRTTEGIYFSPATAQRRPAKEGLRVHCQMYLSQKQV